MQTYFLLSVNLDEIRANFKTRTELNLESFLVTHSYTNYPLDF